MMGSTQREFAPSARLIAVAVVVLIVAMLGYGPAAAQDVAPSAADTPQTIADLTSDERSWLDQDNIIWCTDHTEFRTCVNNAATPQIDQWGKPVGSPGAERLGYLYPADGTSYRVQTEGLFSGGPNFQSPGEMLSSAADTAIGEFAQDIGRFAGELLVESMVWWIKTDSINISYAATITGEKPIQQLVGFIMVAGVLTSAIIMMVTRRTQPAADIVMGGVKYILIAGLSMAVLKGAITATDEIAKALITDGAEAFGDRVSMMLGFQVVANPGGVLFLGAITALLSLIQWLMGFIRQAGILVLYALIIFAAAGQFTPWGRQWFPRLAGACLALILFKPIAAIIFTIGFKLIGEEQTLTTLVTGVMVIALAVIALPSLMSFFSWTGTQLSGGIGAGAVLAGGVAAGAAGAKLLGGGGGGGDDHSNYMSATGPDGGGEHDPTPGNTGGKLPELTAGSGDSPIDVPEGGPSSGPSEAPADGPSTPQDSGRESVSPQTPDLDAGTAGAGAAEGGSAAAAGGAAVTGGASVAAAAGVKAIGAVSDAADSAAGQMAADDTGPDMN